MVFLCQHTTCKPSAARAHCTCSPYRRFTILQQMLQGAGRHGNAQVFRHGNRCNTQNSWSLVSRLDSTSKVPALGLVL